MKTFSAKKEDIDHQWYLVDATDKILGRLASSLAIRLRGKHKPEYTPHVDTGDYIIVINAEKIKVTGNKLEGKIYYRHSGYPGGIKQQSLGEMLQKNPENPLILAVKGMLPKGSLGRDMLKKLKVYSCDQHPHVAQSPKELSL